MADKITPEQLAAADQLNQKLQQGEVNAQEYAAALKEAGLELANQINLIDQKIAKLAQLNASQEENEAISQRISDLQQQRNDLVAGGEAVGLVGNTGEWTSGPHLHFEWWVQGRAVDPRPWLGIQP